MATNRNSRFTRLRLRSVFCLLLFVSAGIAALGAIGSSHAIGQRVGGNPVNVVNKIAPWVVAQTANGQQAEFFVVMADQADLSGASSFAHEERKGALRLRCFVEKEPENTTTRSSDGCVNRHRASFFLHRECDPGEGHP